MNNFILEYYQGICDGSEVVGKWVRLLYEKIITGIETGEYIFDQRRANNVVRFMEKYVRHNKGPLAPQTVKLQLWQKAKLSCIYGILDPETGFRQFTEIFDVLGRKMGKTLIASGTIAYEAYVDGEFGSEIYCLAPKLDQSDLVYSAFEFTKDNTPAFKSITKKRKTDLYIQKTNTTIKKIAFSDKKSDGYNPMLTVMDEMSSWPAGRGQRQYEVITSGTGSRNEPLTYAISSGGYINEGPYDELMKRSTAFLLGNSREKHLLPFLYMIDDVQKWDDLNELRKSLPGMGVSVSVRFILGQIDTARESLTKKAEFLTKYCNVKQSSSQAWLNAADVIKACGEHLDLDQFRECYCVAGIDLSRTTDLTSALVVIEKNGELYVIAHFWMPGEKITEAMARDSLPYDIYIQRGLLSPSGENIIDYKDVYNWMTMLVEEYQILPLKVGYDRYSAQYLVQDLNTYGYHMDDVFQGENLTPVIQETEGLIKDGKIHIGDNDLLKMHMLDSALKINSNTGRVRLVKITPNQHIDGMAALLDAMTVRQKWSSDIRDQLRNDERGDMEVNDVTI